MTSKLISFFRNIVFEFSFLLISLLVFFLSSNILILNSSVTYTRIQLAVTTIRLIQTILIPKCVRGFTETSKPVFSEILNHFRKLLEVARKGKTDNVTIIVGCFFLIYCINMLIISLNKNITITERIYSIVCYTGQKLIELYIIGSVRHIQEMILKNYSDSSLFARSSRK